jgi:hypothetical protein
MFHFGTYANDGKIYQTKFYNLDTVIFVEYRINSQDATKFLGSIKR